MQTDFPPSRAEGLERLREFVPHAGKDYAARRNHDEPGHANVSRLSPYIRHRIVTEDEVLQAVLGRFAPSTAEKFVQEVFWRTYFKGWLEMRPSVWTAYTAGLARAQDRLATEGGLRKGWEQACTGATGIAPFDHWARELVETGYLHNHARMWFASIWTFTLGLPWELGADFFLRHLLDGDPASNTLGWRWVVGLHTPGKVYVARASNITKYTGGRFGAVHGLASDPAPAEGPANPPRGAPPVSEPWEASARTGLVLTEDDLSPGWLLDDGLAPVTTAVAAGAPHRSPLAVAPHVHAFTREAVADTLARYGARLGQPGPQTGLAPGETMAAQAEALVAWARAHRLEQVVAPYPPVGPSADAFAEIRRALMSEGVRVATPVRPFDQRAWPHATHGFFRFKDRIPSLIGAIRGLRAA
ncbi:MAG: FAD-binding domain-containing protein [Paracoccaceae bacterium]|jgi:deoxyribodipyrimidine photo-lyase|nr:FAD-binding domain-containing protein [Paracoccaceae bacterium]